jgi:hypothetical protein
MTNSRSFKPAISGCVKEYNLWKLNFSAVICVWTTLKRLQLISHNFSLNVANFVAKEIQKFMLKFTSRFVNKAFDWSLNKNKPIKCIVYKPVCEYDYELLNFGTKFVTKFATFREKLCEINYKTPQSDNEVRFGYQPRNHLTLKTSKCIK